MRWVQSVSALLVPAIAIFGSWIALNQLRLARNRFKLDLFEKRHAVFSAVRKALSLVARNARLELNELFEFRAGTADAYFLFAEDVNEYLKEVDERLVRFHGALIGLQEPYESTEEQKQRRLELVNRHTAQLGWLTDQLPLLKEKFAPYLSFERWR